MDESFPLDETLPVPAGTSPFHVRGIYYIRVRDHAKSLPGGMTQFLDELVDARVRDFMRQPFHFMTWYDAFPTLPCGMALARIRGRPIEPFMRETGRQSMLRLAPSMFRLFSRIGGPRLAAAHAPRLFRNYFDFVELRMYGVNDCEGRGVASGIPRYAAAAIVNQAIGITTGGLESLGATDVQGSYRDVRVSGSNGGFPTVTFTADFRWSLQTFRLAWMNRNRS